MVHNRIKVRRAEVGISATAIAEQMPDDVDKVAMSYIERGRVLPTAGGMAKMCEIFGCNPTDIYDAQDIDLCAVGAKPKNPANSVKERTGAMGAKADKPIGDFFADMSGDHKGMEQIRVWMPADEKAALFKVVSALGYHSVAEWLRDMYRATVHKYISLNLQDMKRLHEAIPPTTNNQEVGC